MKLKLRNFLGILLLIVLILIITSPNNSDYIKWLDKKHQIACINDGINIDCRKVVNGHDQTIDWVQDTPGMWGYIKQ
jgi:hypothetical protein